MAEMSSTPGDRAAVRNAGIFLLRIAGQTQLWDHDECGVHMSGHCWQRDSPPAEITDAVAKVKVGKQDVLRLGNLIPRGDGGYTMEYVGSLVAHAPPN